MLVISCIRNCSSYFENVLEWKEQCIHCSKYWFSNRDFQLMKSTFWTAQKEFKSMTLQFILFIRRLVGLQFLSWIQIIICYLEQYLQYLIDFISLNFANPKALNVPQFNLEKKKIQCRHGYRRFVSPLILGEILVVTESVEYSLKMFHKISGFLVDLLNWTNVERNTIKNMKKSERKKNLKEKKILKTSLETN